MRLNPPIENLRRSPRLNNIQPDLRPMETDDEVRALIEKLQQQKRALPRVQDTHTPAPRMQGTPMSKETVPAPRVPNTPSSDPKPKLSGKAGALQQLLRAAKATPVRQPSPTLPIDSRTRSERAAATKFSLGPARNTRSSAHCALERALHAQSFLDEKSVSARRLSSQKYPPAIFAAAMAVMDVDTGEMLKHRQLTNHNDPDISRTWNKSTGNEIGRLFQGVGNRIKDPLNTCHFVDTFYKMCYCIDHSIYMCDYWMGDASVHEIDCIWQSFVLGFCYRHVMRAVMIARCEKVKTL